MRFKAIIFDFIGTTVLEKDPSLINQCFAGAFEDHGINVAMETIKNSRGRDKKEIIAAILSEYRLPEHIAGSVFQSFMARLKFSLDNFKENQGATGIFRYLKERKLRIGLGSGLPREIFEPIFKHTGWNRDLFDYIGLMEEIGRSRPHPDMIFDMMNKLGLNNSELLKVGDTIADIQEGKNAGVMTVAILTGTQPEEEILRQQPDFVISSLQELEKIITADHERNNQ